VRSLVALVVFMLLTARRPRRSALFPYTTLFRSGDVPGLETDLLHVVDGPLVRPVLPGMERGVDGDREPEVAADVDYDAGRAEQLAGKETESVLGLVEVAELVHETLGVEGPTLPGAR